MSVYTKLEPTDVIDVVLNASTRFMFVSGTDGWRGNVDASSSVSLFGGVRSRSTSMSGDGISIVPTYRRHTYTIDGVLDMTGSYPVTASVKYVKARAGTNASSDGQNWGEEHWDPLMLLYEYHGRYNPEYHTGSYDYYSVFFERGSQNAMSTPSTNSPTGMVSSSFTMEFWVKPFLTASSYESFTIVRRSNHFDLAITGSTGQLVFSGSYMGIFTSSFGPPERRWSHVVVRGTNNTGSFLIDLKDAGSFTYTGSMSGSGGTLIGSIRSAGSANTITGSTNRSFFGLIHESRLWSVYRSDQQLSASFDSVMLSSGSATGLVAYWRMNQGPLFRASSSYHIGSSSFDYSPNDIHLYLGSFTGNRPVWHPCDNTRFVARKELADQVTSPTKFRVINIPSLMYGSEIVTGSVELTCRAYSSTNVAMVRVLRDDGRGGLYVSGSVCSSSLENKESYQGVTWNKVGNVFYGEGTIVIKDPSLFDFGQGRGDGDRSAHTADLLSISFMGLHRIPTKTITCRSGAARHNASNNPTFARYNASTKKYELVRSPPVTYVTAVGLYDRERRLVAVAKLAQPIRKRERDRLNVRLRIDF